MGYDPDAGFAGVDEKVIRKEKAKARKLRKSNWWRTRISRRVCHYCNGSFSPEELTMDHLVPLARGGKSTKGNLVPACKECNNRKKIMLPLEWEDYMESLDP